MDEVLYRADFQLGDPRPIVTDGGGNVLGRLARAPGLELPKCTAQGRPGQGEMRRVLSLATGADIVVDTSRRPADGPVTWGWCGPQGGTPPSSTSSSSPP